MAAQAGVTLLQDLPLSFTFIKDAYQSQVSFSKDGIRDKAGDGTKWNEMAANETVAMALNEVAVSQKRGFFFHLPNRDRLKNDTVGITKKESSFLGNDGEGRVSGRSPAGSRFPTMMYTDFRWNEGDCQRFWSTPHRARYIFCDGLLNRPQGSTRVHPIQFASHGRYQIFTTDRPSLIVLQMQTAFYVATTHRLETVLTRKTNGDMQLFGLSTMWKAENQHRIEACCSRSASVQELYSELVKLCALPGCSESIEVEEVYRHVPRPGVGLAAAQLLGTVALGDERSNNRSGPRSTKGVRRLREKGKAKRQESEEAGLAEAQQEQPGDVPMLDVDGDNGGE
ncbi:hypothetical protein P171DRAFT_485986 [Karstenula rhodostoma CBS 690.94]|uniref:Uncharacterized protein n=1 Tax=Karstenula rhodostoma CBS 690.94 TaxID=1392251 RepID=A0A9P4PIC7_9PLEO|nr:hypothetical protein P171DRAFT_485986 [Karstenula rhodostoma CBS 690.94]